MDIQIKFSIDQEVIFLSDDADNKKGKICFFTGTVYKTKIIINSNNDIHINYLVMLSNQHESIIINEEYLFANIETLIKQLKNTYIQDSDKNKRSILNKNSNKDNSIEGVLDKFLNPISEFDEETPDDYDLLPF